MAEKTGIQWADATWNPWIGCHKVSAGCKFCYAERDAKRYGNTFTDVRRSKTTFYDPMKWLESDTLKYGSRIFTCSISDFFIEEADEWREQAWIVIKETPFVYMILTKRPERISDHLPADWGGGYPNVWLGTSAENQECADERVPILFRIPASVHFISAEPLLGVIDLRFPETKNHNKDAWVIAGGESHSDRETDVDWIRSLRNQCIKVGIPFFFKQFGGNKKIDGAWGGRTLDGKTWNELPMLY
jgi:protein gp37